MRHALLLLLAVVVCVGVVGCYSTPVMPPQGYVVSNIKAPLSADNQGVIATYTKHGEATVENYLGIISTGDCSIKAAVKDVGIKSINYADYEYFNVLGVYQKFTVHVYGN